MSPTGLQPGADRATRRWRVPAAVFVAVFGSALMISGWLVVSEKTAHANALASEGRAVNIAIQAAVNEARERSQAVTALFHASEVVNEDEFTAFVADVGIPPGMFGIGFIARLDHASRAAFESQLAAKHPGAFLFELAGLTRAPRQSQDEYFPIQFFASPEGLPAWGFDVGSDPVFLGSLRPSLDELRSTASPFMAFPGRAGTDGVVVFQPVFNAGGEAVGVVAAALDLSDLLAAVVPDAGSHGLAPRVADAAGPEALAPSDWVGEIEVADRTWLVGIDHAGGSPYLVGFGALVAGLLTATALAVATAAMGDRIRHGREVEKLLALDRQKDDFLATVSHELRTPLTSVMGFADELAAQNRTLAEEDRDAMLRTIADEAHSMEGIVQDLLAASRLQQGPVVHVAVERVADPGAEARALAVGLYAARVTTHDPGETAVIADRARLRQIIRNLLANAVRHGAPPVEIDVRRKGPTVELTVRDGGPGVPITMQSVIFDKYRAARRDGQPASTGIGLWLSRELARLMGGDLTLAPSTNGGVFVLTLPAADFDLAAGLWGSADARFGAGRSAHLLGSGSD